MKKNKLFTTVTVIALAASSLFMTTPAEAKNKFRTVLAKSMREALKDASKNPCAGKKGAHLVGGSGKHHKGGHWVCPESPQ